MDINEFMTKSLELQERQATALEALVKAGFQQINVAHHECGRTVAGAQRKQADDTGVTDVEDKTAKDGDTQVIDKAALAAAKKEAEEKAAAEAAAKKEAEEKAAKAKAEKAAAEKAAAEKAAAEEQAKKDAEGKKDDGAKTYTADDARKALKAFAAIEGNEAAMALLESLGVGSVSELAEKGSDAIGELVKKTRG